MILVDANLLVYSHVKSFAQHERARHWLDQQLNGTTRVGLPWAGLLAFLRLVTNARVFERPASMSDAWRQVRRWLACETVWIPQPTERHADVLDQFLALPGLHANLGPDAHLAALALEHGVRLRFCAIPKIALVKSSHLVTTFNQDFGLTGQWKTSWRKTLALKLDEIERIDRMIDERRSTPQRNLARNRPSSRKRGAGAAPGSQRHRRRAIRGSRGEANH